MALPIGEPIEYAQQNDPSQTMPASIPPLAGNLTPIAPNNEDASAPAPVMAPPLQPSAQAPQGNEITPQQFKAMQPAKKTLTPKQFKTLVPKHANLDSMMKVAPQAKNHLDALAQKIAGQVKTPHPVIQAPIKAHDRAKEKVEKDYYGDHNKISDLVRNTVVVSKREHIADFIKAAKEHGALKTLHLKGDEDDFMGYSGAQAKFMTPHGIQGEIQGNTPEMIVAKEDPELARKILGDHTFEKVAEKFKKAEVPLGMGHKWYEQARVLAPTPANREKIKELHEKSKKYYMQARSIVED